MKNNVYPCKPQFYYIKVGFKGYVFVMEAEDCGATRDLKEKLPSIK